MAGAAGVEDCLDSPLALVVRHPDVDVEALSERDGQPRRLDRGLGIVPVNALARRYRDTLGRVNATFVGDGTACTRNRIAFTTSTTLRSGLISAMAASAPLQMKPQR